MKIIKNLFLIVLIIIFIIYNFAYKKNYIENFSRDDTLKIIDTLNEEFQKNAVLDILKNEYNIFVFFTYHYLFNWLQQNDSNLKIENITQEQIKNTDFYKKLKILIESENGNIFKFLHLFDLKNTFNFYDIYENNKKNNKPLSNKDIKYYLSYTISQISSIDNLKLINQTKEDSLLNSNDFINGLIIKKVEGYKYPKELTDNKEKYTKITHNNKEYDVYMTQYNNKFELGEKHIDEYIKNVYPNNHKYFFYIQTLQWMFDIFCERRNIIILNNYNHIFHDETQKDNNNFNFDNLKQEFTLFNTQSKLIQYYPEDKTIFLGIDNITADNSKVDLSNDEENGSTEKISINYFKNLPINEIKKSFHKYYLKSKTLLEELFKNEIIVLLKKTHPFFNLVYDIREETHILIFFNIKDEINEKVIDDKKEKFIEYSFNWKFLFLNIIDNKYFFNLDGNIFQIFNKKIRKEIQNIHKLLLPSQRYFERFLNDHYIDDFRILANNFKFNSYRFDLLDNIERTFFNGDGEIANRNCKYDKFISFTNNKNNYEQYEPMLNIICLNQIINKKENNKTLKLFEDFSIQLLRKDIFVKPYRSEQLEINYLIDAIGIDYNNIYAKMLSIIDNDIKTKHTIIDNNIEYIIYTYNPDKTNKLYTRDNDIFDLNITIDKKTNINPYPIDTDSESICPGPTCTDSDSKENDNFVGDYVIENFSNKCEDKKLSTGEIWKDINLREINDAWVCDDYKKNKWCMNSDITDKYFKINNNDTGLDAQNACCVCGGGISFCPGPSCSDNKPNPGKNTVKTDFCPSPSCSDNKPNPGKNTVKTDFCPSPSCSDNKPKPEKNTVKTDFCPSPSCSDNKPKPEKNTVKTDFFIINMPSTEFLKQINDTIKEILKIDKEIKFEINKDEIIFTIQGMKLSDLKNPDIDTIKTRLRYIIFMRLKELNLDYENKQIDISFKSGSVKIIVKLLSLEEAYKKQSTLESKNKNGGSNLIQFKPKGKNGIFYPVTKIGGYDDLNEEYKQSTEVSGMTLN
jgi:hypothetical protein